MRLEYRCGRIENNVYCTLQDPTRTSSKKYLEDYDRWAVNALKNLEAAKKRIELYRLDLMDRYNYLLQNPGTLSIELHRHKNRFIGKVEYYLTHVRTYPDGTSTTETSVKYEGRDRHKAIADFRADCKKHPGAPQVLDIEKSKWER